VLDNGVVGSAISILGLLVFMFVRLSLAALLFSTDNFDPCFEHHRSVYFTINKPLQCKILLIMHTNRKRDPREGSVWVCNWSFQYISQSQYTSSLHAMSQSVPDSAADLRHVITARTSLSHDSRVILWRTSVSFSWNHRR
jgi:hypothetical protein